MTRIILIESYHSNELLSSEIHDRILERHPELAKFDFIYLGIEDRNYDTTHWDFAGHLESLSLVYRPDYILVHTGLGFQNHPLLVIRALVNVSRELPNVKIGFQHGKDEAINISLSGGRMRWNGYGKQESIDSITLSFLEEDPAFQETDDLKEVIKEVYYSKKQDTPDGQ